MSNTQIVMSFIDAWNNMDWDAATALLTDDIVWDNVPMETIKGKETVDAAMRGMAPEAVDWVVLSIAENGEKVLTERIDNFDMPGGKRVELPVMGTFIITNGKISLWRDYFDLASFTSQMTQVYLLTLEKAPNSDCLRSETYNKLALVFRSFVFRQLMASNKAVRGNIIAANFNALIEKNEPVKKSAALTSLTTEGGKKGIS